MNTTYTTIFVTLLLAPVIVFAPSFANAGGVVGDGSPASCTEAALDVALAGGGSITFNCGSEPVTITISNEKEITIDTEVDGGDLVTISGGGQTRIFHMKGNPSLTLKNLTIAEGQTAGEGAGVFMANRGKLTVTNGSFNNNVSTAGGTHEAGGVIASNTNQNWGETGSTIIVQNSVFKGNRAGNGGAISTGNSGWLSVSNSTFVGNISSKTGLFDGGGAIYDKGHSTFIIYSSVFTANQGSNGGAIHVLNANLSISDSSFYNNIATNEDTINGGGGAIYVDEGEQDHVGVIYIQRSVFTNNRAHPHGGAIFNWIGANGSFTVRESTFADNVVTGAGQVGKGQGGAIWHGSGDNSPLNLSGTTFTNNQANISGGGVWVNVPAQITNCTFYGNVANNPDPSFTPEDWYRGFGGAISGGAGVEILNSTIVNNQAGFVGGGIAASGSNGQSEMILRNTIVANNSGANPWGIQQNCTRNLADGGGNLQYPSKTTGNWNDYECVSELPAGDPKLGALASNGGETQTTALLEGSPAIDSALSDFCPSTDQRGFARIDGQCDIGAYEVGAIEVTLNEQVYLPVIMR